MPICRNCSKKFPNRATINGVRRNLHSRKFCLECSPYGGRNTKVTLIPKSDLGLRLCKICGNNFKSNRRWVCGSCRVKVLRLKNKIKAIEYLGGCCQKCGWTGHVSGFVFHHTNGENKEFQIGAYLDKSWERIQNELLKCVLWCANCHNIHHATRNSDHKIWAKLPQYAQYFVE